MGTGRTDRDVREVVRQEYGKIAREGGSCCGSSSCCGGPAAASVAAIVGYEAAELKDLPEGTNLGLSCGNPTALASLREGEVVLDLGAGAGLDAFIAAKKVGPKCLAIGVDMTADMVAKARAGIEVFEKKTGLANVEFRLGEIEHLPVADASVDVVISNCVINLTEDKGKVFREAFRALRKNGRLEVNDVVFGGAILPAARLSQAGWSECVSGALPEQEYVDLVRQAGFQKVSVRRSTSSGTSDGVPIYSVQVSAVKE